MSLNQIAASLRERGVPTAAGAPWRATTLRSILLRPRNAGLRVHRPVGSGRTGREYADEEIIGLAAWPAIVPEPAWRAVRAILTDAARDNHSGNTPRWLGSRIFECGLCDATLVVMGGGAKGYPRYTCIGPPSHLARAAIPVDELVTERLIAPPGVARRGRAAARRDDQVDLAARRREGTSPRELMDEQARLHAGGLIDARQLTAGSAELRNPAAAGRGGPGRGGGRVAAGGDRGQGRRPPHMGLDIGRRRALVRVVMQVTMLPVRPGRGFKPESVAITCR